jgi:predicted enzyme related to lactoylglutathione lyase/mannose-6-phosphate isomerase-like protein (cupin superfamily)
MGHAFGALGDLGEGYGFRKVRAALGVSAFGVNAIVYPPSYTGFLHYHDTQDELYFVHRGTARFEAGEEVRELGPGGLMHVESTTPRRVSNASETEDLVVFVVGGKDGYVERDGHMVDPADIERRRAFGEGRIDVQGAPMRIRRVVPIISSEQPAESSAFYTDVIGLELGMDLGWILGFHSPSNETAQLSLMSRDQTAPQNPDVTIEVEDVEAVYERAAARGAEIVHPLTDEPWGARRFFVRDPNGAVINVMQHL